MKDSAKLTIASLLSILLMTFHLSDDVARGISPGGPMLRVTVPVLVVWLYGTLMLAERKSGYVIMLVGSFFAVGMPVIHMARVGTGRASGFFFFWTLMALGVLGIFSLILAARGLFSRRGAGPGSPS